MSNRLSKPICPLCVVRLYISEGSAGIDHDFQLFMSILSSRSKNISLFSFRVCIHGQIWLEYLSCKTEKLLPESTRVYGTPDTIFYPSRCPAEIEHWSISVYFGLLIPTRQDETGNVQTGVTQTRPRVAIGKGNTVAHKYNTSLICTLLLFRAAFLLC